MGYLYVYAFVCVRPSWGVCESESLPNSASLSLPPTPLVSLLKDLKHANIVTLHDIIHTDKCLTLVFEYLVSDRGVSNIPVHDRLVCSCMSGGGVVLFCSKRPIKNNSIHLLFVEVPFWFWVILRRMYMYMICVVCLCVFPQEKDLKQYMDDCGSIMSVHNVKVGHSRMS